MEDRGYYDALEALQGSQPPRQYTFLPGRLVNVPSEMKIALLTGLMGLEEGDRVLLADCHFPVDGIAAVNQVDVVRCPAQSMEHVLQMVLQFMPVQMDGVGEWPPALVLNPAMSNPEHSVSRQVIRALLRNGETAATQKNDFQAVMPMFAEQFARLVQDVKLIVQTGEAGVNESIIIQKGMVRAG